MPYCQSIEGSGAFLLSSEEAQNPSYFADNGDRQISNHVWWLRTKETDNFSFYPVAVIGQTGTANSYTITNTNVAVRPAVRVNLSSDYFDGEGGSGPYSPTDSEGGFGPNPSTGVADIKEAVAAMYVFLVLSAALWGYIFLSGRKRNG